MSNSFEEQAVTYMETETVFSLSVQPCTETLWGEQEVKQEDRVECGF